MKNALINNYRRIPIAFTHGEGYWLFDENGQRYLDAVAGIAVNTLGHAHPALVQAMSEQAGKLWHCSNLYEIPLQAELATKLCELSGMQAALFCNSGTEANEAAIKLARLFGHHRGIATPQIVVTDGAFHGRTLGALAATGNPAAQKGFGPLPEGFIRVPFGDGDAVAALDNPAITAVLVEPVQGENGVRMPPAGYLAALRRLCDERGWLLMLDEVQTGIGRTGQWFACQHEQVVPDVMALAKGLGGGMPIGALLVNGPAGDVLQPGSHGSTFGGNPLACRAALTVIDTIASQRLLDNVQKVGNLLLSGFRDALQGCEGVTDIRGEGLMLAIQLAVPCAALVAQARQAGLLINVTSENCIRLVPPLILDDAGARQILTLLVPLIQQFLQESQP